MSKSQKVREGKLASLRANFSRFFSLISGNVLEAAGDYLVRMITWILKGDIGLGLKRRG
jgi:hypothetical protein